MKNLKVEQVATANYPYYKYSLDYALASLERIGAQHIEFYACYPHLHVDDSNLSDVRTVKQKLKKHHLIPICFTPEQCLYPVNIAAKEINARKRSMDVYIKSMEFASEMEIPVCQFLAGFGMLDENDDDIWKRSIDSLQALGSIAESYGITIALETSPKEFVCTDTCKKISKMISDVGSPAIRGMIDSATLGFMNENVDEAVIDLGDNLRHIHIGDGVPNGHFAIGEGKLDIGHFLDVLDSVGYKYALSLEILNDKHRRCPEEAMKKSYDWVVDYITHH